MVKGFKLGDRVYDPDTNPDTTGVITRLAMDEHDDGHSYPIVRVKWSDGRTSFRYPCSLYRLVPEI